MPIPIESDQITRYPPKKDMKPILKVSSRRCCCCCCIASDDRGGPCTLVVLPRSRVGEFAASPPSDCALHTTVVARSNRNNNTRRCFKVGCRIVMVNGLGWLLPTAYMSNSTTRTVVRVHDIPFPGWRVVANAGGAIFGCRLPFYLRQICVTAVIFVPIESM